MVEHHSERVLTPVIPRPQAQPVVRRIPGWRLDSRYRQSASQRALLACDLIAGAPAQGFTWAEAAAVAGSNSRYIGIAKTLSPQERARVEAGEINLNGILRERRRIAAEIAKIA